MITEKNEIKTEAVFSDDRTHRYLLKKEWDKNKRKALVLMIAPGYSNGVLEDLTTNLACSNLYRLDFGSVEIVNLFSKIQDCSSPKNEFINAFDENTDAYILSAAKECDMVILAYGSIVKTNTKAYIRALDVVKALTAECKEKLYCISDFMQRKFLHPLDTQIRQEWLLIPAADALLTLQERIPKGMSRIPGAVPSKTDEATEKPKNLPTKKGSSGKF